MDSSSAAGNAGSIAENDVHVDVQVTKKRRLADTLAQTSKGVFQRELPDFEKRGQEAESTEDILKVLISQNQTFFKFKMQALQKIFDRCDKTSSKTAHIEERLMKLEGGELDMERMIRQAEEIKEEALKAYAEHLKSFKDLKIPFQEAFQDPDMVEFFEEALELLKVSYDQRTLYREANCFAETELWRQYRLRGARVGFEDDVVIDPLREPVAEARKLYDNRQERGDMLMKFQEQKDKELFKHWLEDKVVEKFQVKFPTSFKVLPKNAFEYIQKIESFSCW